MEKETKNARQRTTKKQIASLISYIEENKAMIYPCSNKEQYNHIETKWVELKEILNKMGGPMKTVKDWKSVFADLKTNTRRRARQVLLELKETGGGEKKHKELNDTENRILNLINPVVIDGIEELAEPGIPESEILNLEQAEYIYSNQDIVMETTEVQSEVQAVNNADLIVLQQPDKKNASVSTQNMPETRNQKSRPKNIQKMRKNQNNFANNDLKQLVRSNNNIARALNRIASALLKTKVQNRVQKKRCSCSRTK